MEFQALGPAVIRVGDRAPVRYGYVARFRTLLADPAEDGIALCGRPGGYLLQADPEQLGLHRADQVCAQLAKLAGEGL